MMNTNDIIQWVTVGVIIVIAIVVIVRKVNRFRQSMKGDGSDAQCGCGCAGCAKRCDTRKEDQDCDKNKTN